MLLGLIQANIMGTLQSVHFDTFNYTGEKIGCVDLINNCKKHGGMKKNSIFPHYIDYERNEEWLLRTPNTT